MDYVHINPLKHGLVRHVGIGRIRRFIGWWNGAFIRRIGREARQIGSNTKIDIWRNALRLLTPYALHGLNSGADFYAADVEGLKLEGAISLRVFLEACERRGIEPRKHFSGKFSLRVDPAVHEAAVIAAAAHGQSLNQWAL